MDLNEADLESLMYSEEDYYRDHRVALLCLASDESNSIFARFVDPATLISMLGELCPCGQFLGRAIEGRRDHLVGVVATKTNVSYLALDEEGLSDLTGRGGSNLIGDDEAEFSNVDSNSVTTILFLALREENWDAAMEPT
jgi:hypothetical protein